MATVYDLLNADSSEVEEQRVIRAPGATTGDVLTVQANGTIDPAPGGGALPAQWVIDADGTLNILDEFGVTRTTLTADGKLNVYRSDGTIAAQITAPGESIRTFDAAEDVLSHLSASPVLLGVAGGSNEDGGSVFLVSGTGDAGSGAAAEIVLGGGTGLGADGDITVTAGVTVITGTTLRLNLTKMGFFGAGEVTQPTGVAVSAAGIHAALVSLGLITA